ncbi:hypothetical protein BX666DRAFT_2032309 [Dichotomocladium elegans]|nr:hypothetical protein BX666DRAFT_2032309 [Dichotomocladium elegans]
MQALSQATNLSNWTLALALGAAAAIKSGAQQGMEGELPFCDAFMVLTSLNKCWRNADRSGENIFIGFNSLWTRMMLKSFQARRLKYVALLLEKDSPRRPNCNCYMVRHPAEVEGEMENRFPFSLGSKHPFSTTSTKNPSNIHNGQGMTQVRPKMFYGLVDEYVEKGKNGARKTYFTVHKPDCIWEQKIDKCATEFQSEELKKMLQNSETNKVAQDKCKKLIQAMGNAVEECAAANEWDKGIIHRVYDLMKFPHSEQSGVSLNETMDRIHSRLDEMFQRLKLQEFTVDGDEKPYGAADISNACIVYFGILRAVYMSALIYGEEHRIEEPEQNPQSDSDVQGQSDFGETIREHEPTVVDKFIVRFGPQNRSEQTNGENQRTRGLVFMGYNVNVGHELIHDIIEIPTLNGHGYSSAQLIESTQKERLIVREVTFSSVFSTSIFLDLALAVAIMLLSGIGPILSMYTARLVTSPYRESYLKMGTSMQWAVGQAVMFHSGKARDDWMVGIRPVDHAKRAIAQFFGMAATSCVIPVVLWVSPISVWNQFRIDSEGENHLIPNTAFGQLICIMGLVVGFAWVFVSFLSHKTEIAVFEKKNWSWTLVPGLVAHILINVSLTSLPVAMIYGGVEAHWVYLYLLEGIYFCHWLAGELCGWWVYESTALFMIGVIGAIRLSALS